MVSYDEMLMYGLVFPVVGLPFCWNLTAVSQDTTLDEEIANALQCWQEMRNFENLGLLLLSLIRSRKRVVCLGIIPAVAEQP